MLLYRFLSAAALAAYTLYALLRALTGRLRLGDVRGRLGRGTYPDLSGGIWIHAVSVGEVGVASNLLAVLSRRAPGRRLGLSVSTAAGRALAERTLAGSAAVFAFPYELAGPVDRALDAVRPGLVLLVETEIWPLFLDRARAHGVPVALVNGRLSDRSFPRYRLVRRFLARSLEAIALFAMQSREDAERIEALGVPRERIRVCGNIKFDLPPAPEFADGPRLRQLAAGRPILVAASTGEGEEQIALEAFRPLAGRALLAIAPRRPERFDPVASLIESAGFSVIRRSSSSSLEIQNLKSKIQNASVYLLDSIGELSSLYRGARLAFVGGSFTPSGGHNPIEAWVEGVPVVVGPHTHNFRDVTAQGEERGILTRAADAAGIARAFAAALAEPKATEDAGRRAREFVASNSGAAQATAEAVLALAPDLVSRQAAAP